MLVAVRLAEPGVVPRNFLVASRLQAAKHHQLRASVLSVVVQEVVAALNTVVTVMPPGACHTLCQQLHPILSIPSTSS